MTETEAKKNRKDLPRHLSVEGIRGPERNLGAGSFYGSTAHSAGGGCPDRNLVLRCLSFGFALDA
jgi:hypothetical protein